MEPELYFYRTAAGLEVDFLLASERGIIFIEAKSSERVTAADGRSVETFMSEHPDAAKVGLVVYPGDEVVELHRNVWGVPDWYLLGRCNYCLRQSRDKWLQEVFRLYGRASLTFWVLFLITFHNLIVPTTADV